MLISFNAQCSDSPLYSGKTSVMCFINRELISRAKIHMIVSVSPFLTFNFVPATIWRKYCQYGKLMNLTFDDIYFEELKPITMKI